MSAALLQEQCELGQRQLMEMDYLQAEATLAAAERAAWDAKDWDTLSRLYLPLQEARRQRRQRSGEGIVRLDLIAESPDDRIEGRHVVENFPFGQLLVAGWGTIAPAVRVRELQAEWGLFVETFLALSIRRQRANGWSQSCRLNGTGFHHWRSDQQKNYGGCCLRIPL